MAAKRKKPVKHKNAPQAAQKKAPPERPQGNGPAWKKLCVHRKLLMVIKDHDSFFDSVRSEKGIFPAFVYYAILGLLSVIILMPKTMTDPSIAELTMLIGPALLPLIYASTLGVIFLVVLIEHAFIRLLGGKAGYGQTFKAAAYGGATAGLVGSVPAALIIMPAALGFAGPPVSDWLGAASGTVSLLFSLWAMYMVSRGVSKYHGMPFGKAVVATFVLPFVVVLIGVLIAAAAGVMIMSAYSPEAWLAGP